MLDEATRLVELYCDASEETRNRGRSWYREAKSAVRRIADETGYSRSQVAAVMSITSPDAQLKANIRWTRQACQNDGETAGRYPRDQLPKIRAALDSTKPGRYATGPKVQEFYRAIMGDPKALVLDRWALRACGLEYGRTALRTARAAYEMAASATGETVRDFQAIVWIQLRESSSMDSIGRRHNRYCVTN